METHNVMHVEFTDQKRGFPRVQSIVESAKVFLTRGRSLPTAETILIQRYEDRRLDNEPRLSSFSDTAFAAALRGRRRSRR